MTVVKPTRANDSPVRLLIPSPPPRGTRTTRASVSSIARPNRSVLALHRFVAITLEQSESSAPRAPRSSEAFVVSQPRQEKGGAKGASITRNRGGTSGGCCSLFEDNYHARGDRPAKFRRKKVDRVLAAYHLTEKLFSSRRSKVIYKDGVNVMTARDRRLPGYR